MEPQGAPGDVGRWTGLGALLDPAAFSRVHFGWEPYPYQRAVLDAILLQGKQRIAWVAGRQVGKTTTIANAALQLAVRRPGIRIANFAPTLDQAGILAERIRGFLDASPFRGRAVVRKKGELRLRWGSDAAGRPRDSVLQTFSLSGSVRGHGADVVIFDESAFCKSEDYASKALPFIAASPDAVIVHISTVWADDDHFTAALEDFEGLPRGAVFRTATRENPLVTAAYLAEMRGTMPEEDYRREYEADSTVRGGVFDRHALRTCLHDFPLGGIAELETLRPKRDHRYSLGVDWGKKQDRAVIAVVEQGTQAKRNPARLVFLQVYPPDPANPHHYARVLDDVQKVARQVDAFRVVADEGEGGHQAEVLRRALGGRFVPYRFTAKARNWLVDNARLLVDRRALELPLEPEEVRRAFLNVRRKDAGYDHASRKTKDVFDAIAMALYEAGKADGLEGRAPRRLLAVGRGDGPSEAKFGPLYDEHGRQLRPKTVREDWRTCLPRETWRFLG